VPNRREHSTNRETTESTPHTLSLPSIPRDTQARPTTAKSQPRNAQSDNWEQIRHSTDPQPRRELVPTPERDPLIPTMEELQAISRHMAVLRANRQPSALLTPPRSIRRILVWQGFLLVTLVITFLTTLHPSESVGGTLNSAFQAHAGATRLDHVVDRVPTFIQIDPTIGYKSQQQYDTYSNADCSAAATSEVLTAWSDPNGSIGQVIEDMGDAISPSGGLVNFDGFRRVAQKHHFGITQTDNITTAQLAQIVTAQGLPVIIGVRDTYGGYYRYFAPGHFLVVTGADANGFRIVDSSTYFVHYLPTDTFVSLWDHPRAVILYSEGYGFQMPS
jgi:hypothetical protein